MRNGYDRAAEDLGNIVALEHVNTRIPDQQLATAFYVSGLGLTRDPYLMTGTDNMWVNVGRSQFHLPTSKPEVLRGRVGIVVPGREALLARLARAKKALDGTRFGFSEHQGFVEAEFASRQAGRQVSEKVNRREKDKAANEAMVKLAQLRDLSQQSILRRIKKLDEAGARARTVAMVITAAALLFGMALSFGITRSIVAPLFRMKKKTGEIAEGIFEADLDLSSPPEIGALAGAFNSMCMKLQEVDRMKSDFYALMSHELRTPLTSIREGTNMFLEGLGGEVSQRQRELLTIIAEESSRLIDLVNPLLELSKLQAGVLPINLSQTDLPPLIARSLREVAPLAAAKNITIESDIAELPPAAVEAERAQAWASARATAWATAPSRC